MKFDILEADTDFSVGPVRTNFGDLAKRIMLDRLDELKDFFVS